MRCKVGSLIGIVMAVGVSPAAASPSAPGSGYRLDWERQSDRVIPGAAPPGWAREYLANPQHSDGQPAARVGRRTAGEPVRDGDYSARFDLRANDINVPGAGSKRAELAASNPVEQHGVERWYGFSLYLKDWTPDPKAPEIVTQWHQSDGVCSMGCSPPLSLLTDNTNWVISQNWQKSKSAPNYLFCHTPVGKFHKNLWTDWVVHVKWSTGTTGKLEIWRDGHKLTGLGPINGRTDDYGDPNPNLGNYMKIGIYKWKWASQPPTPGVTKRVLFHDALRIAGPSGSYAAVAPRPIRSGLPIPVGSRTCT
jgi:hypothetical protein